MLSPLSSVPCAYDKHSLIKQHQKKERKKRFDIQSLGRKKQARARVKPQPNLSFPHRASLHEFYILQNQVIGWILIYVSTSHLREIPSSGNPSQVFVIAEHLKPPPHTHTRAHRLAHTSLLTIQLLNQPKHLHMPSSLLQDMLSQVFLHYCSNLHSIK